ncbi:protein YhfH [Peribacillus tepidiphilus]|jgi:ribosomal protein L37AE/L43A
MKLEKVKMKEFIRASQMRKCPECGEKIHEYSGWYIMECDRCLSKRPD